MADANEDLLAAVLRTPDSDGPRIAFAAHCDAAAGATDAGRERGGFIRDQLALARLGRSAASNDLYRLRERTKRAERRHGALPWLRYAARNIIDATPDRFAM